LYENEGRISIPQDDPTNRFVYYRRLQPVTYLCGAVAALPYDVLKDFEPISLLASNPELIENKDGGVIAPDALPTSLEQLPDDPYRTLAWMVRKRDGFCRALMQQKEFAEFIWADWMRGQNELPPAQVAAAPKKCL
jgi:hypothetical protein